MWDSTTVQSTRTLRPFSIPLAAALATRIRLIASSVSAPVFLMSRCRVLPDGTLSPMPNPHTARYVVESAKWYASTS